MSRFLKPLLILGVAFPLTSCSVFYPNWGATGLPENQIPVTPSQTSTPSDTGSPTAEPTASGSESPTESATATPTPTLKKVSVEILFAMVYPEDGVVEVVAQVPNLSEKLGECVLTLSGPVDLSLSVSAEPSSDFMQCEPFDLELSKLTAGSYQAVVEYHSETHTGESAPYPIEVP